MLDKRDKGETEPNPVPERKFTQNEMEFAEFTVIYPIVQALRDFIKDFKDYCSRSQSLPVPKEVLADEALINMLENLRKGQVEACQQAKNSWRSSCEQEDWENPRTMSYKAKTKASEQACKIEDWGLRILETIEKAAIACRAPPGCYPPDAFFKLTQALKDAMVSTDRTNEQEIDRVVSVQAGSKQPKLAYKARDKFEKIFRNLVRKMVSNVSWISQIRHLACCEEADNSTLLTDGQDTCEACSTFITRFATTIGSCFGFTSEGDQTARSVQPSASIFDTTFTSHQYRRVKTSI